MYQKPKKRKMSRKQWAALRKGQAALKAVNERRKKEKEERKRK